VKPSPTTIDASAHPHSSAPACHIHTYNRVDARSVAAPSRYDVRRPRVSAITPVGISKPTCPAVKNALAVNAPALLNPASSRNRVLTPQMNDAASVESNVNVRYVRITRRAPELIYRSYSG
jgi:hypothetical protein